MVALSASVVMADRRHLRMIIRAIGSVCQRADVPLVFGGSGAWPDPPSFGTLVRAWEDFNSLLRHQTYARVGNHRTGIR
jgi:hypothetical protein